MIKVSECGATILSDHELLDNVAKYIRENVGEHDWGVHVSDISGYLAAGIAWHPDEVVGYLKAKLREKVIKPNEYIGSPVKRWPEDISRANHG